MALYKREEKANFLCMNVVSCELTYEKYFNYHVINRVGWIFHPSRLLLRDIILGRQQDEDF